MVYFYKIYWKYVPTQDIQTPYSKECKTQFSFIGSLIYEINLCLESSVFEQTCGSYLYPHHNNKWFSCIDV